jgi:hypothetical protein
VVIGALISLPIAIAFNWGFAHVFLNVLTSFSTHNSYWWIVQHICICIPCEVTVYVWVWHFWSHRHTLAHAGCRLLISIDSLSHCVPNCIPLVTSSLGPFISNPVRCQWELIELFTKYSKKLRKWNVNGLITEGIGLLAERGSSLALYIILITDIRGCKLYRFAQK